MGVGTHEERKLADVEVNFERDLLVVHPQPTFYISTTVHSPLPKDNPFQTTVYDTTQIILNPNVSCNGVGRWNVDTICITGGSIYSPW
ncbi:unnamed protein product [Clavelina lepadiformis]|uniref:Uncharacterized protein n=1 Tax=Clavelina lepadiformis TaxID=159417 RepID=A0ABP0F395_CLALP